MQNLPRATREFNIRHAIAVAKHLRLLSADYDQLELRLMAELSHDQVLCEIFSRGKHCDCDTFKKSYAANPEEPRCRHIDPHTRTAEDAGVSRQDAKPVNFGAIYGMGAPKLQGQIFKFTDRIIPMEQAEHMLRVFFNTYSGVRDYHHWVSDVAVERGWIKTILGRRRHMFFTNTRDRRSRGEAFRELTNSSVQGSAADVMMLALRNIWNKREAMAKEYSIWKQVKFVSMIHDEVIMQSPEEISGDVKQMIVEEMEGAVRLQRVNLTASCGVGRSWGEAH